MRYEGQMIRRARERADSEITNDITTGDRLKCVCGWWLTEWRIMQEWKMHCSLRGDAKYKEDIVNTGFTGAAQGEKKKVQVVLLR